MDLTVEELQQISHRQQQQIASQTKLITEREARLNKLRQAKSDLEQKWSVDGKSRMILKRLEEQDLLLRHLRGLKAQVKQYKAANDSTKTHITAMKNLSAAKQRELAGFLDRVDALYLQLSNLQKSNRPAGDSLSSSQSSGGASGVSGRVTPGGSGRITPGGTPGGSGRITPGGTSGNNGRVTPGSNEAAQYYPGHQNYKSEPSQSPPVSESLQMLFQSQMSEAQSLDHRLSQLRWQLSTLSGRHSDVMSHGNGRSSPGLHGNTSGRRTPVAMEGGKGSSGESSSSLDSSLAGLGRQRQQGVNGPPHSSQSTPPYQPRLPSTAPSPPLPSKSPTTAPSPPPRVPSGHHTTPQDIESGMNRQDQMGGQNRSFQHSHSASLSASSSSSASKSDSLPPRPLPPPPGTSPYPGSIDRTKPPVLPTTSPASGRRSTGPPGTPGSATPQYASRSVINSTYMRRMATQDSVEKYKRSADEIYRNKLAAVLAATSTPSDPPTTTPKSPPLPPRPASSQRPPSVPPLQLPSNSSAYEPPAPTINATLASGHIDKAAHLRSIPSPRFIQRFASHEDVRSANGGTHPHNLFFTSTIQIDSGTSESMPDVSMATGWSPAKRPLGVDSNNLATMVTKGNTTTGSGLSVVSLDIDSDVVKDRLTPSPSKRLEQEMLASKLIDLDQLLGSSVSDPTAAGLAALSLQPGRPILKAPPLISPSSSPHGGSRKPGDGRSPASSPQSSLSGGDTRSSLSGRDTRGTRRGVKIDPLALLLDASQEGDIELVRKTAAQMDDVSKANDEGITALHNAICAGHTAIVDLLIELGTDVNAGDADGWTPLHCAASCGQLVLSRLLVEAGAVLGARTHSDMETPLEKCDLDAVDNTECEEYLYDQQQRLGTVNSGCVFSVFPYTAESSNELSLCINESVTVVRKPVPGEPDWFWCRNAAGKEGYVARNYISAYQLLPKAQALAEKRFALIDALVARQLETLRVNKEKERIQANQEKSQSSTQQQADNSMKTAM